MTSALDEAAIIHQLYDAAEDTVDLPGSSWRQALSSMMEHVRCDRGHLFLVDTAKGMTETCAEGYHDETTTLRQYHQHFQHIDPRFELGAQNPDRFFIDSDLSHAKEFERSEIYNDFLKGAGVRYSLFGNMVYDANQIAPMGLFRLKKHGAFDDEDRAKIERLAPHLKRALRMRRLFAAQPGAHHELDALLEALPLPVAALTASGELVYMNSAAGLVLSRTPSLTVKHARLLPRQTTELNALTHAVAAACRLTVAPRGESRAEHPRLVTIAREGRRPLALRLFPILPRHRLRTEGDARLRVLIIFHDPDAETLVTPAHLEALYALTPTEAQLAAALAEGKTLTQFSLERGTSEQTARVHLKRIFEKTRTFRQADLVRLLLSGGALSNNLI